MGLLGSRALAAGVWFVFAAACSSNSGSAGSSCGAYFDKLTAFDKQCAGRATGLYAAQRDAVVAFCDELSSAPGVSNLSAQVDACTQSLDPSTCTAPDCAVRGEAAAGAPCANGAQCQSGLCVLTAAASSTTELECGTCNALATKGGDCNTAACDDGLYCDTMTKTCVELVPLNGACANGARCAASYACINFTCSLRVGVGGACPSGQECQLSLTCSSQTHTCVTLPIANAGEACGLVNGDEVVCGSGLVCAKGVCSAPKLEGSSCTVGNLECAYNLVCTDGTCQPRDFSACK